MIPVKILIKRVKKQATFSVRNDHGTLVLICISRLYFALRSIEIVKNVCAHKSSKHISLGFHIVTPISDY